MKKVTQVTFDFACRYTMGNIGSSGCKLDSTKRVVVIGGSYAGRSVVHLLGEHPNITWIDRRGCMIHKMLLRSSVCEGWVGPALVPHDRVSQSAKFSCGNVTLVDVEARKVHYSDESGNDLVLEYDYLIVASGATNSSLVEPAWDSLAGSSRDSLKAYFEGNAAMIAKHDKICIVGGGPVGCELAGEIKARHPNKTVVVANRTDVLCSNMRTDKKDSNKIEQAMKKFGIQVLLNKDISVPLESKFVECDPPMDIGATAPIDLLIKCVGSVPNTEFMPKNLLTESGHIKVNEFLQVKNHENIYAIGDCNDVAEPKLFATAGTKKFMFGLPLGQADVAVKNLCSTTVKMAYKPATLGKPKIMLPLGPRTGIAINVPNFFVRMKAKNFFYPAHWRFANASPPKEPK